MHSLKLKNGHNMQYAVTMWQEGKHMLERIIAIDEFWSKAYEPELKHQSAEWRHAG